MGTKRKRILIAAVILILMAAIGGIIDHTDSKEDSGGAVIEIEKSGEGEEAEMQGDIYVRDMVTNHNFFVNSLSNLGGLLSGMDGDDNWFNEVTSEAMAIAGVANRFTTVNPPNKKKEAHEKYLEHAGSIEAAVNEIAAMFGKYKLTDENLERLGELSELIVSKAEPLSQTIDLIMN
ncbi:MAG: hypothetical protein QM401_04300 [Bacillota bacterium]|nr:hypothetical protein [Bacillota bacterium]